MSQGSDIVRALAGHLPKTGTQVHAISSLFPVEAWGALWTAQNEIVRLNCKVARLEEQIEQDICECNSNVANWNMEEGICEECGLPLEEECAAPDDENL